MKTIRRVAGVLILMILVTLAAQLLVRAAIAQLVAGTGPSFSCDKATTSAEKLICSDRELSGLDLQYSRVYAERAKGNDAEALYVRDKARELLESRDQCTDTTLAAAEIRPVEIDCLLNWYYSAIAQISDFPAAAPSVWSPELVGGGLAYVNKKQGLLRTRTKKRDPEIYFKRPGGDQFFKMSSDTSIWPASFDPSNTYNVYRNVLGSLTLVERIYRQGLPSLSYFFNKDGRLAAQTWRLAERVEGTHYYAEFLTVFYNAQGQVTRRLRVPYFDRKITTPREGLLTHRLENPKSNSFAVLFENDFKKAGAIDPDQLGVCYIDLSDGYGKTTALMNLEPQSVEAYARVIPSVNFRDLDEQALKASGSPSVLGTLSGKRVYSVTYTNGITAILFERQPGRFLPFLFVKPENGQGIDALGIETIDGQDLLTYSSTVSGTGHFTNDYQFVLVRGIPKLLDYHSTLNEEIERILPAGWGVRKGGNFNFSTLTLSSGVWTENDASGGSVEIVLGLKDGKFFVKSSHWTKPDSNGNR